MREEKRTIYHCEYCKKYLLHKSSMVRHESACKKNPDIKLKCGDCCHWTIFEKEDFIIKVDWKKLQKTAYNGTYPNEYYRQEDISISWAFHYCLEYEKKMMPPKAFKGFYGIVLNEVENTMKMPTENEGCPNFKCYKVEEISIYRDRLAEAYRKIGDEQFRAKNYNRAVKYYNKVINIGGYDSFVYDACIRAYELLNNFEDANIMREKKMIAEKEEYST